MNFGVIMKKYAWAHGLKEDLNAELLKPFIEEAGGKQLSDARMAKATTRFEQLREMMGKRWKMDGFEPKKKKAKKKTAKK